MTLAHSARSGEELKNMEEDLKRKMVNAVNILCEMCVKCEAQKSEIAGENEGMSRQIRELKEQQEEEKHEMVKMSTEFNILLQKIRDDERKSLRMSGLVKKLQEKNKIILRRERKIQELNEKHNA
ncbi:uncharacterized protein MONOS_8406c1 [Monocercomonoides exilis]|uniref:uncharacterized protein n=1 Tax=Monocercomonoides exilis TaxID=2049356 RepID=UPI0035595B49|nr:hypothetical protein MONOS_8406c2 [Monocercomonoides exilis]KAH7830657.1 hypothetical protein MONOS_8406c1 [Monocercomonoides exilis]|eukprot:MONOS_8406.1-p1 / transcript=MONOS_8406.1 / gene=MONOS_8406 / organism=Monocercomonoides_exilis_PA203 / gene_product=unspecified product / transcript_product=unspecified product / location=Mono_scaffold00316:2510-2884(-) / protein_length=125 / sequence_SO=supercontig / SO=protein_coding / is_pseudo=false